MEQLIKCVIIYMKECIYFNLYTRRRAVQRSAAAASKKNTKVNGRKCMKKHEQKRVWWLHVGQKSIAKPKKQQERKGNYGTEQTGQRTKIE